LYFVEEKLNGVVFITCCKADPPMS